MMARLCKGLKITTQHQLCLSIQAIDSTLQTATIGSVPTRLQQCNRLIDVRVQLNPTLRKNDSQLQQVPIICQQ